MLNLPAPRCPPDVAPPLKGLKESGARGMPNTSIMLAALLSYIVPNFFPRGSKKFLVSFSSSLEACVKVRRFFRVVSILDEGLLLKTSMKVATRPRRAPTMAPRGPVIVDPVATEYMNVPTPTIPDSISRT